jgi:hypothetical protein
VICIVKPLILGEKAILKIWCCGEIVFLQGQSHRPAVVSAGCTNLKTRNKRANTWTRDVTNARMPEEELRCGRVRDAGRTGLGHYRHVNCLFLTRDITGTHGATFTRGGRSLKKSCAFN